MYSNKNFLSCAFIITDGQKVFSVSSGGMTCEHPLYAVNGSGSTYVMGLIQDQARTGLSFYEARDLAIKSVAFAI